MTMNQKNIVIIPIYKESLKDFEIVSLKQCLHVFSQRPVFFVTYRELTLDFYNEIIAASGTVSGIEFFDKTYFDSVWGYNNLLLSLEFYSRFHDYENMLIYQLDAYAFQDDLDAWCTRGYDYIGAPWFKKHRTHEEGKRLWKVGNGGFSLRRIKSYIDILSCEGPLFNPWESWRRLNTYDLTHMPLKLVFLLAKYFGYKNTLHELLQIFKNNEDVFWSSAFVNSSIPFRVPSAKEAISFAFEKSPGYLFKMNGNKLPFGCHAWQKYEFDTFWKQHINLEVY